MQSIRDGKFKRAEFKNGVLCGEEDGSTEERNGTFTQFVPDQKLFPKYAIKQEYVERRLWMYAFLNSGLSLYYNNQRYYSKSGLMDLVNNEVGGESLYQIIHYKDKTLEFALCQYLRLRGKILFFRERSVHFRRRNPSFRLQGRGSPRGQRVQRQRL